MVGTYLLTVYQKYISKCLNYDIKHHTEITSFQKNSSPSQVCQSAYPTLLLNPRLCPLVTSYGIRGKEWSYLRPIPDGAVFVPAVLKKNGIFNLPEYTKLDRRNTYCACLGWAGGAPGIQDLLGKGFPCRHRLNCRRNHVPFSSTSDLEMRRR